MGLGVLLAVAVLAVGVGVVLPETPVAGPAAEGAMKGVLGYTDDPLVSMDFNHDPHSSVFASEQTKVMDGNMVRILTWYDNEWGFSNRMADTAVAMGKLI